MKEFNYLGNAPIKETYPEANRLTTFFKKVMFVFWKKLLILKENYIRNNFEYDFSLQNHCPLFRHWTSTIHQKLSNLKMIRYMYFKGDIFQSALKTINISS